MVLLLKNQPKPTETEIVDIIRDTPFVRNALNEKNVELTKQREKLLAEMAEADAAYLAEIKTTENEVAAADRALQRAEQAFLEARSVAHLAFSRRSNVHSTLMITQNRIRAALTQSADNASIDEFRSKMLNELDLTQNAFEWIEKNQKNNVTGRVVRIVSNNSAAIAARVAAINAALQEAEDLRFIADQSTVRPRLAALAASLPTIESTRL